jgi:hypothetical protein
MPVTSVVWQFRLGKTASENRLFSCISEPPEACRDLIAGAIVRLPAWRPTGEPLIKSGPLVLNRPNPRDDVGFTFLTFG